MAIILISISDITLDQVVGNHLLHWHLLTGRISHALTLHRCGQRAGFAPWGKNQIRQNCLRPDRGPPASCQSWQPEASSISKPIIYPTLPLSSSWSPFFLPSFRCSPSLPPLQRLPAHFGAKLLVLPALPAPTHRMGGCYAEQSTVDRTSKRHENIYRQVSLMYHKGFLCYHRPGWVELGRNRQHSLFLATQSQQTHKKVQFVVRIGGVPKEQCSHVE